MPVSTTRRPDRRIISAICTRQASNDSRARMMTSRTPPGIVPLSARVLVTVALKSPPVDASSRLLERASPIVRPSWTIVVPAPATTISRISDLSVSSAGLVSLDIMSRAMPTMTLTAAAASM
ncbi:MAG: hypothetical protein L0I10_09660 [Bifidobacterium crudilactis]|nr:hypothetical protein [Bifidobacterium crudilactis]MDN6458228.1 hypothetical protein [Bifidobacterium crudilactis]MDN6468131.1 hypothetical protein [Bifidobacterium crudilactis]MDN6521734.1 hypothetical protein [Bifidobacterium crudilactis]